MKMEKSLFWGSAFFCCVLAFTAVGCSSDDDKQATLNVDNTYVQKGIEFPVQGGVAEFAVTSSGEWTASVPDDCNWVNVVYSKGKSGDKVCVLADLCGDGISRHTTLTLKSDGLTVSIPVNQIVNKENSGEYKYARSKGLGRGYDVINNEATGMTVFNYAGIEKLCADDDSYGDIFYSQTLSKLDAQDARKDSLEDKKDSLVVKLSVQVSYGKFKFNMSGSMDSHEKRFTASQRRTFAANYPLYEATVEYGNAIYAYNSWIDDGCPANDLRSGVLSKAFGSEVKALNKLVDDTNAKSYKDNADIEKKCKKLIDEYSPMIITDVKLGGYYQVTLEMDSIYTKEHFSIDSAKVSAKLDLALFKIEAGVDVDYLKDAIEILQNSNYNAVILGGESDKQQAMWSNLISGQYTNRKPIDDWAKSLTYNEKSNTGTVELLTAEVVPVWVFFNDSAADILKEYILSIEAYKNNDMINKYRY